MSRRPKTNASPANRAQTVYFAFGSNLHLGQMAKRCPESRYLGRGALPGYKWQINTRGYANIFESPSNTVEGLCFLLSKKDEERLDRCEGVNMEPSAYEKGHVGVVVYPSNPLVVGRRVHEVDKFFHRNPSTSLHGSKDGGEEVKALVYMSYRETGDGPPNAEYIGRIHAGIRDAELLGVPALYFYWNVLEPMYRRVSARGNVSQAPYFEDQRQDMSSGKKPVKNHGTELGSRHHSLNLDPRRQRQQERHIDGGDYLESNEGVKFPILPRPSKTKPGQTTAYGSI